MRYYLSGPMTGLPNFNYAAFNIAAKILRHRNFDLINPAENFDGRDDLPREDYMRQDIKHLLECDAIILINGWEKSRGAKLELEVARQLGLEIYTLSDEYDLEPFNPEDIFEHQEAEALVYGSRNSDYGHPLDDFSRTAQIWSAILGYYVEPEQVALCMVGLKLSREVNKPKRDNIVDAHGYLMTYRMVRDEQALRGDLDGNIAS